MIELIEFVYLFTYLIIFKPTVQNIRKMYSLFQFKDFNCLCKIK